MDPWPTAPLGLTLRVRFAVTVRCGHARCDLRLPVCVAAWRIEYIPELLAEGPVGTRTLEGATDSTATYGWSALVSTHTAATFSRGYSQST